MNNFCGNCGKKLNEGQDVCLNCGTIVNKPKKNDKFAIAGFVLGLTSIITWLLPLVGYPTTICGIVFSAKGLKSNNKNKALAGLILSIIFAVFTLGNSIAGMLIALASYTY